MSENVKIDVHEIMQHLREVGGGAAFTLNANGSGALDLASGPTLRWGIYPDFVLKFRGLKRQDAEKLVVEKAKAQVRYQKRNFNNIFATEGRDLMVAVDALHELEAGHE